MGDCGCVLCVRVCLRLQEYLSRVGIAAQAKPIDAGWLSCCLLVLVMTVELPCNEVVSSQPAIHTMSRYQRGQMKQSKKSSTRDYANCSYYCICSEILLCWLKWCDIPSHARARLRQCVCVLMCAIHNGNANGIVIAAECAGKCRMCSRVKSALRGEHVWRASVNRIGPRTPTTATELYGMNEAAESPSSTKWNWRKKCTAHIANKFGCCALRCHIYDYCENILCTR